MSEREFNTAVKAIARNKAKALTNLRLAKAALEKKKNKLVEKLESIRANEQKTLRSIESFSAHILELDKKASEL